MTHTESQESPENTQEFYSKIVKRTYPQNNLPNKTSIALTEYESMVSVFAASSAASNAIPFAGIAVEFSLTIGVVNSFATKFETAILSDCSELIMKKFAKKIVKKELKILLKPISEKLKKKAIEWASESFLKKFFLKKATEKVARSGFSLIP